MNKSEFIEIIIPLAEYYGKTLTDAAMMVYFEAAKFIDALAFQHLVKMHMTDPDQGKFFPTLAHIVGQASDEKTVSRQAGIAFDKNPKIDGTSGFDVKKESKQQLETRRRHWIASQSDDWKSASAIERIAFSEKIPLEYKTNMLISLDSYSGSINLEHANV